MAPKRTEGIIVRTDADDWKTVCSGLAKAQKAFEVHGHIGQHKGFLLELAVRYAYDVQSAPDMIRFNPAPP